MFVYATRTNGSILSPFMYYTRSRSTQRGLWEGQKRPRRGLSTIAWTTRYLVVVYIYISYIPLAPPTSIPYLRIHHFVSEDLQLMTSQIQYYLPLSEQYIQLVKSCVLVFFGHVTNPLFFLSDDVFHLKLYTHIEIICHWSPPTK